MIKVVTNNRGLMALFLSGLFIAGYVALNAQIYSGHDFFLLKKYDLLSSPTTIPLIMLVIALIALLLIRFMRTIPVKHVFFIYSLVGVSLMQFNLPLLFIPIFLCYLYYFIQFMMGKKLTIRFSWGTLPMYLLFAISFFAYFTYTKEMKTSSLWVMRTMISRMFVYTYALNLVREEKDIYRALKYIFILTLFESFVCFYQSFVWLYFGKITFRFSETARVFTYYGGRPFVRTVGTFNQAGSLGILINFSATLLFFFILSKEYFSYRRRVTFALLLGVFILAFLSNSSRSNWVGFICAAGVFPLLKWPKHFYIYILITPVLLVLLYALGFFDLVVEFISSINKASIDFRFYLIKLCGDAMNSHPISGLGTDLFKRYPGNWERLPIHNSYLMVCTDFGIPAGIIFLFYYLSLTIRIFLRSLTTTNIREQLLTRGFSLVLLSIFIASQFDPSFYDGPLWIVYGICESTLIYYKTSTGAVTSPNYL